MARGSTDRFRLLLRRYPHQSSTRSHTGLHTRPTHSPSKEFRLHSLNHLQEFRLKLLIPFQELRLDSRLRAFGPRALRPPYPIPGSYLTPSQVFFCITYLLRYNTTQHVFLPGAGFNPPDFPFLSFYFFDFIVFFPSPCDTPVSCCLAT